MLEAWRDEWANLLVNCSNRAPWWIVLESCPPWKTTHLERSGLWLSQYKLSPSRVQFICSAFLPRQSDCSLSYLISATVDRVPYSLTELWVLGRVCAVCVCFTRVISNYEEKTITVCVCVWGNDKEENEWMQWLERLILRRILAPASTL